MFSTFVAGALLGYGACIPIGPINILLMNYALRSFQKAFVTGLGAMSADLIYLSLLSFGIVNVLNEDLAKVLGLIGGLFLIVLGVITFRGRHQSAKKKHYKERSLWQHYMQGLLMTLLNPYTFGFWASVSLIAAHASSLSLLAGAIVALLSWIIVMPYLIHRSRHLISEKVLHGFAILSSLILAGFGVMLIVEAI